MRFRVVSKDEALKLCAPDIEAHDPNCYIDEGDWYDAVYGDYLWDDKKKLIVYADGGEPEDMILCRNLRSFVTLLNEVDAENG